MGRVRKWHPLSLFLYLYTNLTNAAMADIMFCIMRQAISFHTLRPLIPIITNLAIAVQPVLCKIITWNNVDDHTISFSMCSISYGRKSDVIMSAMASHWRLHCLLNRVFRRKLKKTQSSASLSYVSGLHRWRVFNLGTETFSGYVRHPIASEPYYMSDDRGLMFATSVRNILKCLMLSTLGTHLVVFMSVIVHVSHWYQSHNIMREFRWKVKAILPPNTKLIQDGNKTNSVQAFWNYIIFFKY